MNEHLTAGELCYRIIREFEKAPLDCRQTADGAALDSYLCPSSQATLGFGCCYWPDGREVVMGESIEPHQVDELLAYNLKYCEDYVREHVNVELNQNQFSALCSFRFNTRETTLRNSSRLLPAINAKQWQAAAVAMTEFVYGSGTFEGKPYQKALRGLLRRRLWEGLIFLGYDPADAVKQDDVALPSDRKLLSSGVYRDMIRSEGVTTLNQVKMKATLLPDLAPKPRDELVLDQPAPAPQPASKAGQPEAQPSPPPVVLPPPKPAAPPSPPVAAGAAAKPTVAPLPTSLPQAPVKPTMPIDTKPPPPPVIIAPKQIDPRAVPYGEVQPGATKNMSDSTRVIGMVVVGIGSIVQILAGREIVSSTVGAVFFDMSRDPVVVALIAGGIAMAIGWLTRKRGVQLVTKGMVNAQALLK